MLIEIVHYANLAILWYLIFLSAGYILLLVLSIPDILFHFKEVEIGNILSLTDSNAMPPVTIIVPAFNEENALLETLYSVFRSNYPNIYIIVVNDGSSDSTLNKIIDVFEMHQVPYIMPNLVKTQANIKAYYLSSFKINLLVVDKEHSGKSDSLNVGVNLCRTPLFITLDADAILEPNTVNNIVYSMLTKANAIAVGGAVYILNGCEYKDGEILQQRLSKNPLYGLQASEYLRSFLFCRSGWNKLGGSLCYAGALTLFEHREVVKIKGFEFHNVAQDFEVITHLHAYKLAKKAPYNISYTPAARVWTDVPGTLKDFWHQRFNWQFGSLKSLMKHKKMLFNYKYGLVGFFTYPFFLFGEILGPVVEFTAYLLIIISWYLGILDIGWTILFIILCWGLVSFITMATVLISFVTDTTYLRLRDVFWIFLLIMIESFGFRQYHVICRVFATIKYVFTKK